MAEMFLWYIEKLHTSLCTCTQNFSIIINVYYVYVKTEDNVTST